MMSLPDFQEKQILFIEARYGVENALQFQNDNVLYKKDGRNTSRLSCFKVFAIFIIGNFTMTSSLVKKCKQYGISLFLLSDNFLTYAEINSGLESNFILRDKQYKFEKEFEMAKMLVQNKIINQIHLLKEKNKTIDSTKEIAEAKEKIKKAKDEKELLGIEGNYSKNFFSEYFKMMDWIRRSPRTKFDINNVLLDIGYTFLFNFMDALLRLYGFDVYKGFYHKLFFQRKSLVCDVMEPFRCLIDKQILKSNNLGQINRLDFRYENRKYTLNFDAQRKYVKIFLEEIMKNKEEMFNYVRDFYRFFVVEEKEFPVFLIKK